MTRPKRRQLATRYPGIYARHQAGCDPDTRCTCSPTYQAKVHIALDGRRVTETFPTLAAARSWAAATRRDADRGERRAGTGRTLNTAWAELLADLCEGAVLTRSHQRYGALTISRYDQAMRRNVLPTLGGVRVADLTSDDVAALVQRLRRGGASGSTIRNALTPLQVLYRQRSIRREAPVDPVAGATYDAPPRRARAGTVVMPDDARRRIAALGADTECRVFWALVFFAGLRRNEAIDLAWRSVDLDARTLRVEQSKTSAGVRTIPLMPDLRRELAARRLAAPPGIDLVVGLSATAIRRRTIAAWNGADPPITIVTPHDARKTFASILAEAAVDEQSITRLLGHADFATTRRHYLRALPGANDRLLELVENAFGLGDPK